MTEVNNGDLPPATVQLDPQHQLFVEKYFELGFNQTQAAIAAKYSSKSARNQAYRLMKNDDIRAEIDRRLAELSMGKNEVLARLAQHGRGDMREFIGLSPKQLKRHPNGNLIKEFELAVTTTFDDEGKPQIEEKIKVKLYDGQAALVQIGRYHKLFTDNVDHTSGGEPISFIVQGVMDASDSDALAEQYDQPGAVS